MNLRCLPRLTTQRGKLIAGVQHQCHVLTRMVRMLTFFLQASATWGRLWAFPSPQEMRSGPFDDGLADENREVPHHPIASHSNSNSKSNSIISSVERIHSHPTSSIASLSHRCGARV
ncbi:hypothetical protein DFJ77DRAFT_172569 [Powellomyces hirtus]|nr:hypothetical protein DFJ77DRAFT_172569 [Powellomyces hirtus]